MTPRVIVEADGGSRGNPGPASYGALVRDADTGIVIAQRGETIGVATNNVAEYSGLIAGLELVREHAPEAQVEVRMDSKLVIEQMAGRWRIKHPDMVPLAVEAKKLLRPGVVWTWVPREKNAAADALANAALDDQRDGGSGLVSGPGTKGRQAVPASSVTKGSATKGSATKAGASTGWGGTTGEPTTVILLRHGVTTSTERKLFCGTGGSDPGLTPTGREQAARAAASLARRGGVDAILSSPLQRTRETAGHVAEALGLDVSLEPGFTEASFGDWDGFSFGEILERWPVEMKQWLASTSVAPPGGDTFDVVDERVADARARLLETYAGRTVVVVSHVTPIKLMVRQAIAAPMRSIYQMELSPASLTTIAWWPDGNSSLRAFNTVPEAHTVAD